MHLGLRAKLTMVMTGLVLLSSLVLSLVFLEQLMQQVLHDTDKRANELAREVFDTAKRALDEAKSQGVLPASSDPQETHDYVQRAFEISEGLKARLQTATDLRSGLSVQRARAAVWRGAGIGFYGTASERHQAAAAVVADDRGAGAGAVHDPGGAGERGGAHADPGHSGAVGTHFFGRLRRPGNNHKRATGEHRRTGTGAAKNHPGGPAIAGCARDFQFAARKHEFGDGGTRRWADPVHAGCARRDGEPGGGEISGGAGFQLLGAPRDGYFSAGTSAARGAAPGGRSTARGSFGDGAGNTGREEARERERTGNSG